MVYWHTSHSGSATVVRDDGAVAIGEGVAPVVELAGVSATATETVSGTRKPMVCTVSTVEAFPRATTMGSACGCAVSMVTAGASMLVAVVTSSVRVLERRALSCFLISSVLFSTLEAARERR